MWDEDLRSKMYEIRRALDSLQDDQRKEIFDMYCSGCGCKQPWHPAINKDRMGCQCENDE